MKKIPDKIKIAKFKVLKFNQICMSPLGIYSHSLTSKSNKFFKSIGTYYIITALLSAVYLACTFIYENWPTSLGAFQITSAGLQGFGMFLSVGLNMRKTKVFHLKLQEIVDKSTNFFRFILWNVISFNFHQLISFPID